MKGVKGGKETKKRERNSQNATGWEEKGRKRTAVFEMVKTMVEKRARQIKKRKDKGQKTCEREKKSRDGVTFPSSRERKRESAREGAVGGSKEGICFDEEQSRM